MHEKINADRKAIKTGNDAVQTVEIEIALLRVIKLIDGQKKRRSFLQYLRLLLSLAIARQAKWRINWIKFSTAAISGSFINWHDTYHAMLCHAAAWRRIEKQAVLCHKTLTASMQIFSTPPFSFLSLIHFNRIRKISGLASELSR